MCAVIAPPAHPCACAPKSQQARFDGAPKSVIIITAPTAQQSTTMRPPRNGVTGRVAHAHKAGAGKPIGRPPRAFTDEEKQAWYAIVADWTWADLTHRKFAIATARLHARVAELKAHPAVVELRNLEREKVKAEVTADRHREEVRGGCVVRRDGDGRRGEVAAGDDDVRWSEDLIKRAAELGCTPAELHERRMRYFK